ncbi:DNA repair rhp42 [Hyphodiscus hymeniophilus]|uniref:DNA repair rhp42 n=1 Tax=Hyphodiscus hymeniophilus TaxID=353542 RepID=A0A9P6VSE6_9HELO|nr:DNA repair rhp42 [Hyphodiscus hymeniophilus]
MQGYGDQQKVSIAIMPSSTSRRKRTLFEDVDAGMAKKRTAEDGKAALEKLAILGNADDDSSSLSSLSDDKFEDITDAKRRKIDHDSDDDAEFMDVDISNHSAPGPSGPIPSGDLELTLRKDPRISLTNPLGTKKGPSKIEREIRIQTHKNHVQWLMLHNAIRNSWLCDEELQAILISQLPPTAVGEFERWRRASGLELPEQEKPAPKGKGRKETRNQRDWSEPGKRPENGQVNKKGPDPIFRLLRILIGVWKRRFRITAPGLRKLGYMSLERLDELKKSFDRDEHDPELHGERIRNLTEFRKCAQVMEGSRDVSAQLFTALLRGLGIEARMVANLQPVGFAWSQNEEASEKNPRKLQEKPAVDVDEDSSEDEDGGETQTKTSKGKGKAVPNPKKATVSAKKSAKSNGTGHQDLPIDLSDSDSDSVVDITPAKQRIQPSKPYDKDLLFPHYWTEVLSPVTNTYTAVDPVVLDIIATNPELLGKFEPRGARADKAKQVTSYIIAHSPDGSGKDVTTRYLKRQMWPGRTKGNRIVAEEEFFRSKNGELVHYGEYDWFKEVMRSYVRGYKNCPRTEIDDLEDTTDLKPLKPEKKEVEEGKETLQSYKASDIFVLERHLKRDEAPIADHVKTFVIKSKGEEIEEKVYLRTNVVACKSTETWHKEGRVPRAGEQPRKQVNYRAATLNRSRQLAEAEHQTGEKMLQGLFSVDQTELIIPPPIRNGIILKNDFGNIDLYVDTMLPRGAVHIPKRGTVKICKQLDIDYAEAVTGFEFGNRFAVPIISGVVVAAEHYDTIMETWVKDEEERVRKEDEKRRKIALDTWKRLFMQWRIRKYLEDKYGGNYADEADTTNAWSNLKAKGVNKDLAATAEQRYQEDMAGGFLHEGEDDDEDEDEDHHESRYYIPDEDEDENGGGLVIE